MKKIMIICNSLIGLMSFRKELLETLLENKYKVFVVAPEHKFSDDLQNIGVNFIPIEMERRGINPIKDIKLFFTYLKIIKENKPDIVLTYTIKPNIYGGYACSKLKIPYITTITGLGTSIENKSILQKISLFMYKIGLKKSGCVFFQNETNMKFMQEHKVIKGKYKIVPGSGVNIEKFSYQEYPDKNTKEIRLLFIGRIMQDKGINELIESAKIIKKKYKNIEFDLIGECEEDYRKIFEEIKDDNLINYYGEQENVKQFISNSHAIVLPSYHEGLSNALLEGAAIGRPVLTSNVPGCKETFDEGISGLGFEVKNANSLTNTIEKFINLSYTEKKQMGINGRKKMEKEFDRNIVVKAYLEEINKIKKEEK